MVKDLAYTKNPKDLCVHEIRKLVVYYVKPQSYEVNERANFYSMIRRKEQTIKDFILKFNRQAAICESKDLET